MDSVREGQTQDVPVMNLSNTSAAETPPSGKTKDLFNNPIFSKFRTGQQVTLFYESRVIGTARLALPKPSENLFSCTLHGHRLNEEGMDTEKICESSPPFLVVITNFVMSEIEKSSKYPYVCPGPEGSPETFGDMFKAGLYVWDVRCMEPMRGSSQTVMM